MPERPIQEGMVSPIYRPVITRVFLYIPFFLSFFVPLFWFVNRSMEGVVDIGWYLVGNNREGRIVPHL